MSCRIQYDYRGGFDPQKISATVFEEAPKPITCGNGTILKENACVPKETPDPITCAAGTFLKDNTCFLNTDFTCQSYNDYNKHLDTIYQKITRYEDGAYTDGQTSANYLTRHVGLDFFRSVDSNECLSTSDFTFNKLTESTDKACYKKDHRGSFPKKLTLSECKKMVSENVQGIGGGGNPHDEVAISHDGKETCTFYRKEKDEANCTYEHSQDEDFYTIPKVRPRHPDFYKIVDDKLQFDNEYRKVAFDIYRYCASIGDVFNEETFEQCLKDSQVDKLKF